MTDALREAVKAAVRERYHTMITSIEADAAIRAVLTYYAENGPTDKMVMAIEGASAPLGDYTTVDLLCAEFQAAMRAALAERTKP